MGGRGLAAMPAGGAWKLVMAEVVHLTARPASLSPASTVWRRPERSNASQAVSSPVSIRLAEGWPGGMGAAPGMVPEGWRPGRRRDGSRTVTAAEPGAGVHGGLRGSGGLTWPDPGEDGLRWMEVAGCRRAEVDGGRMPDKGRRKAVWIEVAAAHVHRRFGTSAHVQSPYPPNRSESPPVTQRLAQPTGRRRAALVNPCPYPAGPRRVRGFS